MSTALKGLDRLLELQELDLSVDRLRSRRDRPSDRAVLLPVQTEGEREEDPFRERRGESVREPEMGVRLGERARDPAQPRGEHHRPRDEAAGAEHRVRPAAAENAETGEGRRERLTCRTHETGARPPREPGNGERVELVAELRNEPRLDAIRRPGERHQPSAAPKCFGDRQGRRDVSDCPAGRDQEPQLPLVRHYVRC